MRLYEYQGKELFAKVGVPIPEGKLAKSTQEVVEVAKGIGYPIVLKSQVLSGKRGKAGGSNSLKMSRKPERQLKLYWVWRLARNPLKNFWLNEN